MGGFNIQTIAAAMFEIKMLLAVVFAFIGLSMVYRGFVKATWAAQMGGINSMGTRDFSSEAALSVVGGLVSMNVSTWAAAGAMDLMGSDDLSWTGITVQTEDPMLFMGEFLVASFWIIGFAMVGKSGQSAPKIQQGQISAGAVLFYFIFGIVLMNFQWLNREITSLVPFNPLGIFFDQPLFTIS